MTWSDKIQYQVLHVGNREDSSIQVFYCTLILKGVGKLISYEVQVQFSEYKNRTELWDLYNSEYMHL